MHYLAYWLPGRGAAHRGERIAGRLPCPARSSIVAAALAALLAIAGATEAVAEGRHPESAGARIRVTARVAPHVRLRLLHQPAALVVTDPDVARGYVDVPDGARLEVRSNDPRGHLLVFEVADGPFPLFENVQVRGLGPDVQIGPGSGAVPQPAARGVRSLALGYRFTLRKDARAGSYAWPVFVSAVPE